MSERDEINAADIRSINSGTYQITADTINGRSRGMTQRVLARFAAALWPYIRPYILKEIEHAKMDSIATQATAAAERYIAASERMKRKYVGES